MKHTAYQLQEILNDMQNSNLQVKILIIDACRSNAGARGGVIGFAPIFAPKGTIIAFATSPGQAAKEKNGHGIFTGALLQHISSVEITIEEMFKRVRNTVYIESAGSQVTWEHTSLMGKFLFNEISSHNELKRYSKIALADANYEPESNGKCYELIQEARTYNYNYQNTIPGKMSRNIREMYDESPDDIFVLGRNLYQASENAFEISNYFEQLSANLMSYREDFANHLLSGMAYEIYFDSNGRLRKQFKIMECYTDILVLLNLERYKNSLEFIVSEVSSYSQKVFFIPGKIMMLEVILKPIENRRLRTTIYLVERILFEGMNVMYNEAGDEPYRPEDDYCSHDEPDSLENVQNVLTKVLAGTRRGVQIVFKTHEGCIIEEADISMPVMFSLLKYAN